jgi:hypothetical protein
MTMTKEDFFRKHFNDEYEDVLGIEFKDDLLNLLKSELIKFKTNDLDRLYGKHPGHIKESIVVVDQYLQNE